MTNNIMVPLIMPWKQIQNNPDVWRRHWSHSREYVDSIFVTRDYMSADDISSMPDETLEDFKKRVDDTLVERFGYLALYENYITNTKDPARPNATDEERLAAGWTQQVADIVPTALAAGHYISEAPLTGRTIVHNKAAAPGPAGQWRIQGNFWVRWVA